VAGQKVGRQCGGGAWRWLLGARWGGSSGRGVAAPWGAARGGGSTGVRGPRCARRGRW
jgi:hypothetical protein